MGLSASFDWTRIVPVNAPAAVGSAVTVKVVLCPGASVSEATAGACGPDTLKDALPLATTVGCTMFNVSPPLLVTVNVT